MSRLIANGNIKPCSASPVEVWSVIRPMLRECGCLLPDFKVSVGRRYPGNLEGFALIDEADIEAALLGKHASGDLFISHPADEHLFQFIFFPERGAIIGLSSSVNSLIPWDKFFSKLSEHFVLNSITLTLASCRASQREYFKPPNTDLLKAPGLIQICRPGQSLQGLVSHQIGISAEMWIGDEFWQHVKCTRDDVLKADWMTCEDRGDHLHLIAWPRPFDCYEGEQAVIQRKLLKLLFDIG